jgi:uncharacterized membrane protein
MHPTSERVRGVLRYLLAAVYLVAGAGHLWLPEKFLAITPDWVPAPQIVILATGLLEIAGALALLTRRWRRIAGIMLALYAVCVFPANIKHALDTAPVWPLPQSWWYHAPRLAFQPVFVWWALFCAGVIDWPARRAATTART